MTKVRPGIVKAQRAMRYSGDRKKGFLRGTGG